MPIDDKTYRRNSRSTQTEDIPIITKREGKVKSRSLLGSVFDFVTTATTSASLEFDRLCESFGIANKDSESEYEYVTDSEEGDSEGYENPAYDDSEVEKLEVSSTTMTIPTQTPSRLEQTRSTEKSNLIKAEYVKYLNHMPVAKQTTQATNAKQPIRRWSPPPRHTLITKKESSSDEEWKPPDVREQVRRIHERMKQNNVVSPSREPVKINKSPIKSFNVAREMHELSSESIAIKQESPIKRMRDEILQSAQATSTHDVEQAARTLKYEDVALATNSHSQQMKETPEQVTRKVTFASPERTESEQDDATPSSSLHLYNLKMERERVERLEKELASVKAKVESLSATSLKAKKDGYKTPQSVHELQVEDTLPSPSISPSDLNAESVHRNKRYSPIIAVPTPLIQVSPDKHPVMLKPTKNQEEMGTNIVRKPDENMKKLLIQIPAVKLRRADVINLPDGTVIANKIWYEIYKRETASPFMEQAQAISAQSDLITDNCAGNELHAARQNVSPGANPKRKHSISTYENNNSQHDQSNTKKAKLL